MQVTIINSDRRFPMATMGFYAMLPFVADASFDLTIIDEEVKALEYESRNENRPYRFLGLASLEDAAAYLQQVMSSSSSIFFLTLWIVDGDNPYTERLSAQARALAALPGRASRRRHIILVNDYKRGNTPRAVEPGWMAIVNRDIESRQIRSEQYRPYQDALFFYAAGH